MIGARMNADKTVLHNPFVDSYQKRILVVEDDRTHRSFMEKILKDCHCDVTSAENGLAALAKLTSGQVFDLIIMDWDMPELNGLETVKIIRARQAERKIPYIPIIAFTAKREPGDKEKCLAAGMDGYLPKDIWMPHWRQSLVDILQGLISGNFDIKNFTKDAAMEQGVKTQFNLDEIDRFALEGAAGLLKSEFKIAVREYLEDAAAYIQEIRTGLSEKNFKRMEANSHPLKSNSKSFGLIAVSEVAESINTLTRTPVKIKEKMEILEKLVPQLEEAFANAEKTLRKTVQEKNRP